MKIVTSSFKDTQKFGEEFSKKVKGGDVLLLFGNLGAGKTTFMQGLAKGFGIEKRIISPTFIIIRRYELNENRKSQTAKQLYHIDLYRAQTEEDLLGLGLEEILTDKNAIVAIEWSEKLGSLLPKIRWELHFKALGENKRSITIEKHE